MNTKDTLPKWVVCVGYLKEFSPRLVQFGVAFVGTYPKPTVRSQYFALNEIELNTKNAPPPMAFGGWMIRAKVHRLTKGSNKTQIDLFTKTESIFFRPRLFMEAKGHPLLRRLMQRRVGNGSLSKLTSRIQSRTSDKTNFTCMVLLLQLTKG